MVVTRAELAKHVWKRYFDPFGYVIDVTMHQLREKSDRRANHRLIHTIRGGLCPSRNGEKEDAALRDIGLRAACSGLFIGPNAKSA